MTVITSDIVPSVVVQSRASETVINNGPLPQVSQPYYPPQVRTTPLVLDAGTVGGHPWADVVAADAAVLTAAEAYTDSKSAPVSSVAGKTGAVLLNAGDVGLGNVTNDTQLRVSQLVTTVGNPGSDTNIPSEKAIRTLANAISLSAGAVTSVNGKAGAVVLITSDIGEAINKRYVTDDMFVTLSGGVVPTSTTVNGQALSSNVTLNVGDLGDAVISSPADGQALVWDVASGKWKNKTVSGASGTITAGSTATNITGPLAGDGAHVSAATMFQIWGQSKYNPRWLTKWMMDQILQGTLATKTATPVQVTRLFGTGGDSGGIGTWTGTWNDGANYRGTATNGDTVSFTIRTDGANDIHLHRVGIASPNTTVSVKLDSNAPVTWNQQTTEDFVLSAVPAGVHTIILTNNIAGPPMQIGSLVYYQLPYQDVGVAGDVAQVIYSPDWFYVTSIAITNALAGAGTYNSGGMGEAITHRLPLGGAVPDSSFTRASCVPAGVTQIAATGLQMYQVGGAAASPTGPQLGIGEGMVITLSSSAGTRGKQFTADGSYYMTGITMANSIYRMRFIPLLAKIVTPGVGSAFSAGDTALLVITDTDTVAGTAATIGATPSASNRYAAGLYKLPSSLP